MTSEGASGSRSARWPASRKSVQDTTCLPLRSRRDKTRGLRGAHENGGSGSSRNIRRSFVLRIPASRSGKRSRIAFPIFELCWPGQSSPRTTERSACSDSANVSCLEVLPSLYPNGAFANREAAWRPALQLHCSSNRGGSQEVSLSHSVARFGGFRICANSHSLRATPYIRVRAKGAPYLPITKSG